MKIKIIEFITANGWEETSDSTSEYLSFEKSEHYGIDVGNDEVVLVDETGDFMHLSYKAHTLYTLLGVLLHFKQITMGYKWL